MSAVAAINDTGEITRKQSLFEIGAELEAIFDAYEQLEGDHTEEIKAQLEAWFETISLNLEDKLCAYRHVVKKLENLAKWQREEAERGEELARINEAKVERLKNRLIKFFEASGNTKIETRLGPVRIQNNAQASVIYTGADGKDLDSKKLKVDDFRDLPPDCIRHKPEVDTTAVRAKLEAGEELPFAKLVKGKHVRFA